MINSSVIISGEASETDSDEDNNRTVTDMPTSIQAAMITGEDSESDDENQGSISSAVSVLTQSKKEETKKEVSESDNMHKSLLHKKLRECNNQMYTDLESFCQNMITQAGKNLSTIDQQLLKSQNTLQTAVTSLRSLHVNSAMIKDRLQNILSSKFLTNIK